MRNQKQRSATTANVQKCWGPCMAVQAVPGQAALLTHLTSPCTPSPRGWGGQQGLSLPHASFQGKRRAEEGLSQCGGPSQAGTGPSLPESDGGQTWFLLLRERPSNDGHSTITLHRQPCGSVKQEAPGERPGPGRRPGTTAGNTQAQRAFGLAHECAEPPRPGFLPHRHVRGAFWSARS